MSASIIDSINTLKEVIKNKSEEFREIKGGTGGKVQEDTLKGQIKRMKFDLKTLNKKLLAQRKAEKKAKKGTKSRKLYKKQQSKRRTKGFRQRQKREYEKGS